MDVRAVEAHAACTHELAGEEHTKKNGETSVEKWHSAASHCGLLAPLRNLKWKIQMLPKGWIV